MDNYVDNFVWLLSAGNHISTLNIKFLLKQLNFLREALPYSISFHFKYTCISKMDLIDLYIYNGILAVFCPHFLFLCISVYQSAPLPEREVSSCLGSFFLFGKFLLVREVMLSIYLIGTGRNFPYGRKSDSYKMELELKYGFWNFNFFLDW